MKRQNWLIPLALTPIASNLSAGGAWAEPDLNVTIDNFQFVPNEVAVKAGTRIVFVNRDRVSHSIVGVVGDNVKFRSREQLDEDETFTFVFE